MGIPAVAAHLLSLLSQASQVLRAYLSGVLSIPDFWGNKQCESPAWQSRGVHPGLGNIHGGLADLSQGSCRAMLLPCLQPHVATLGVSPFILHYQEAGSGDKPEWNKLCWEKCKSFLTGYIVTEYKKKETSLRSVRCLEAHRGIAPAKCNKAREVQEVSASMSYIITILLISD